jgi:hypothetical protein
MTERYELTYDGPPAMIRLLAQMLAEDGISIDSTPDIGMERRDGATMLAVGYGLGLAVNGLRRDQSDRGEVPRQSL